VRDDLRLSGKPPSLGACAVALALYVRLGCDSIFEPTGGLRWATTSGYYCLATLRVGRMR